MKAIILVAGYATRLYPLTQSTPKALLPIGGRPIIDYILDQIETLPQVDEIYVVSNHKFAGDFEAWAKKHPLSKKLYVLDDGTTTEENRRGAIGDILFAMEEKAIDDELLVVAGDNYFTYSLADFCRFYQNSGGDCVCVKALPWSEDLSRYGIAVLGEGSRVMEIEEKPKTPKSNTVVYATYFYQRKTLPLIRQYLAEGNNPDAPGHFPAWLARLQPVYAYAFAEECYDIGTPASLQEVSDLLEGKA